MTPRTKLLALGAAAALAALFSVRLRNAALLARLSGIPQSIQPPLSQNDARGVRERIVREARAMRGLPYDPFKGRYGDPLKPWGFVVCIDVPVRSYQAAGVSLPRLLSESARAHPEWFRAGPGNLPQDPFFPRRVRNYYDLFTHHPDLQAASEPAAGDLAFFGRWHIGLVTAAGPDGRWRAVEATPRRWGVVERDGEALVRTWGQPHFFGRLRESAPQVSTRSSSSL
ncbi:MAG: hypothetical protein HY928_04925 [Elusimicrobia bacterium]|nr:hypothetical protein [Elusimicrobiota bacterium]